MNDEKPSQFPESTARPGGCDSEAQPAPEALSFPIVGIGASAGGLAAFEAFFSGMPPDPGMAFVLVQHLAPDHKSILTELIQRSTRMRVFEVENGMAVQGNCIYIIPPDCDMALVRGTLQLIEPSEPRGHRLPIDFFFQSLAQDLREKAIGIVLSGTGSDGTLGVRAIKAEGGMVIAQYPASSEFNGMPNSAIATGLVDCELPPAEMPAKLIAYVANAFGRLPRAESGSISADENALKKIFILLRTQTGHDFSQYKPGTIHRRVERRMAVHQIDQIDDYVHYLQQTPAEVKALFGDLLIGVTQFFRDPEGFKALEEQVIPRLFEGKPAGTVIRVWSPGCSTGEEVYSIAILLQEHLETLKQSFKVQIFATDIDSQAIATARTGLYPASIATNISPHRLARFFSMDPGPGMYRIHKGIRDMLVFSEQDLIKDPPFSRLDLISCRNLLIYMGGDMQKKIIPLFHYALNPGGFLFLGTSETVGEFDELFVTLDRKLKLFRRKGDRHSSQGPSLDRILPSLTSFDTVLARSAAKTAQPKKQPLRELIEQELLQQAALVGALVDGHGDILYLHGRSGLYLEPASGEASISNILKMAREGLRHELTMALYKAVSGRESVSHFGLRVKTNGDFTQVNLTVRPVTANPDSTTEPPIYLVVLEKVKSLEPALLDATPQAGEAEHSPKIDARIDARIDALKLELQAKDEFLQTYKEELETSNEELKSTNEEMQSVNEELQSTNEELETSKEELQSINEELSTVNAEFQSKVLDLSQANNDMNNLLSGTDIGSVFVDHQLRILRFTPAATRIINLIRSDVGRPLGHTVTNLAGYNRIVPDAQAVLDTLIPKEMEVQTTEGKWFMMRLLPYRTLENVVEGAVITFVDISEIKRMQEDLRRLAVIVRDSNDAIIMQDLSGNILAWNPAAERIYGWSEAEALKMKFNTLIPQHLHEKSQVTLQQLSRAEMLHPARIERFTKAGRILEMQVTATALVNDAGQVYAIATTERANER